MSPHARGLRRGLLLAVLLLAVGVVAFAVRRSGRSGNIAAWIRAMEPQSLSPKTTIGRRTPSASRSAGNTRAACTCMKSSPQCSFGRFGVDAPV